MSWNQQKLEQILVDLRSRGYDSTEVEVKSAHRGVPQNLGETISAFANMPDGGVLILGVDEKNGFEPIGVAPGAEAGVASVARNDVSPSPHLDFSTLTLPNSEGSHVSVLVVEVKGLSIIDRPALYKGDAYLRQSDGDYRMNDAELRMIEVAKLHAAEQVLYDEGLVEGTTIDDCDRGYLDSYAHEVKESSRRLQNISDEAVLLRTKGLVDSQGVLTLAGLYALGYYPQGQRPALTVTAAVQLPSESGARIRNKKDFDGPLPALLEDVVDWCAQNLPQEQRYDASGHMRDETVVPLVAVREFVANALVHRDLGPSTLGVGKSVQIRITGRCLIIESPGGLRGLSVEQLRSLEHSQVAVNQRLYDAAKYLRTSNGSRIIEGEGGGVREAFEIMRARGMREPQLINSGVKFKVILWFDRGSNLNSARVVSSREDAPAGIGLSLSQNSSLVLEALKGGEAAISELATELGLTAAQVRYAMRPLLAEGLVDMDGVRGSRATVYRLREGS